MGGGFQGDVDGLGCGEGKVGSNDTGNQQNRGYDSQHRPKGDTQQAAEHILIMNNGMFQYWVTMDTPETLHQLTQRILSQAFRAYTDGLTLEPPQE